MYVIGIMISIIDETYKKKSASIKQYRSNKEGIISEKAYLIGDSFC